MIPTRFLKILPSNLTGSSSGTSSLLKLSEGLMSCSREERQAMVAMYERETRREKVLGGKEKEGRARKMEVLKQAEEAVYSEVCIAGNQGRLSVCS